MRQLLDLFGSPTFVGVIVVVVVVDVVVLRGRDGCRRVGDSLINNDGDGEADDDNDDEVVIFVLAVLVDASSTNE